MPGLRRIFCLRGHKTNLSLTADTAVESASIATVIAMTMINNKRKELLPCGIFFVFLIKALLFLAAVGLIAIVLLILGIFA